MTWGGLNPALTSWRQGIVARFPKRGSQSDGGYADKLHGSTSEHQADDDGTVDAFDCDVNFLGSSVETGNPAERRICEALKADFADDPRAQLWIHQREIANGDVRDWAERDYSGASPHDHHIHFQSRQGRERDGRPWAMPRTDALLRELNGEDDMAFADEQIPVTKTTGRELYEPDKAEGTKVPAHIVLQLSAIHAGRASKKLDQLLALVGQLVGRDFTDEAAIAQAVIAALPSAQAIADAIPEGVAAEVVDLLAARMAT